MVNHMANIALAGAQSFFIEHSNNRIGNVFYSMCWYTLSLPFTILTDFLALNMFTPTNQHQEYPMGAKKITSLDDLGDVTFKTAMNIAVFAPITWLSKSGATFLGFGDIKRVQEPFLNPFIENTMILILKAVGIHLLGCLFASMETAEQDGWTEI